MFKFLSQIQNKVGLGPKDYFGLGSSLARNSQYGLKLSLSTNYELQVGTELGVALPEPEPFTALTTIKRKNSIITQSTSRPSNRRNIIFAIY